MNKKLDVYLAGPRGFCAGVERAILMVQEAIKKYGAPVYVRHEIVHNKHVVDGLKKIGAIFVEEIDEIEDKTRPVIFSAHGVPENKINRIMNSYEFNQNDLNLTNHIFDPQKIGNYGYPLNNKNYARGGHGLFSTIVDYSKFIQMLHTGKSEDNKKILEPETLNFMITNHL